MKTIKLPSGDGVHKLHIAIWEPETEVKAVLQISHGMIEMISRYDHFARFLNEKGVLVIGNDHLGHGLTVDSDEELGYFCPKDMSATVVADLHSVTEYAKKEYPDVPYFIIGFSMGSLLLRRYLMTYKEELNGALLAGTGEWSRFFLALGKTASSMGRYILGDKYRSKLFKAITFGSYNARIPKVKRGNEWLTKDETIQEFCRTNKYSNFSFTVNGYRTLAEVSGFIQKTGNMQKLPKKLPILMLSGTEDPVGGYGKGVQHIYETYKQLGVEDIELKLYEGYRHEVLNELDKDVVYDDIYQWMEQHMK